MYPAAAIMRSAPRQAAALGDTASAALARYTIPDGDGGAYATVDHMARLIRDGSTSPTVRRAAVTIVAAVPPRQYDRQIGAVRRWLAAHVQFIRDPDGTELLHTPDVMLESIATNASQRIHVDCDDVAILGGALGKSIGLLCRIVTVSFKDPSFGLGAPATGDEPFAHTWAELAAPVGVPTWRELDTTRSAQRIDPRFIARSFTVEV